jgi:cytochrome c oxidase subunit 2
MNLGPIASDFTEVDQLYMLILVITGLAFFLTEGLLVYSLFRFRARDGQKATYVHGHHQLEVAWAVLPGLVLFGLAVYQYGAWTRLKIDLPAPEESVQIELAPEQFLWKATYPGADGVFGTGDDFQAPNNVIHVPVNEPVLVSLRAVDVIHSFFVPAMRVKQDALPGTLTQTWFQATEEGEFEVACAELCGPSHYTMNATLTVESRAAFDAWSAEQEPPPSAGLAAPVAANSPTR